MATLDLPMLLERALSPARLAKTPAFGVFINGTSGPAASGRTLTTINPATGNTLVGAQR
jgi:hypothetical protein